MIDVASFKVGTDALAALLREGKDEEACFECGRMLQLLTPLMTNLPVELQSSLLLLARQLLQCQERHDWVGLSDYLEFELPVLLDDIDRALR
ncbi:MULTISPECIES: hypothetical protein [Aeromonas]|uniref:hypothetical protein n=1 Tax=Aeromonas TaxID=642 RepID=UPI001FCC89AC|nr:hypothetical protein [Aeromonas dhakensis]MCJ2366535.1 hypothetical protein [Aeromonas dhakensis]WAG10717.1 hypothetical protein NRZ32_16515 [Aeromonas dhakensis]WDF94281.1 hypothetical protein PUB92_19165 [Aeromonas dhakensis]